MVIEPGRFVVQPGVPCRNGVRKHTIVDAAITPSKPSKGSTDVWKRKLSYSPGETTLPLVDTITRFERPYCGERGDSFIISLRISQDCIGRTTPVFRRSGY